MFVLGSWRKCYWHTMMNATADPNQQHPTDDCDDDEVDSE